MAQNQEYSTKLLSLTEQLEDLRNQSSQEINTLRKQQAEDKTEIKTLKTEVNALQKQQVEDKTEVNTLRMQQVEAKKEIENLGKSVHTLLENRREELALKEYSEWVVALRDLMLVGMKKDPDFKFKEWSSFAKAESNETRSYDRWQRKKQGTPPSRPLHDILVTTHTAWGFNEEEWTKLSTFKGMRDDNFHSPNEDDEQMLSTLPQSLKSYSSVLAKAMKVVNDNW